MAKVLLVDTNFSSQPIYNALQELLKNIGQLIMQKSICSSS